MNNLLDLVLNLAINFKDTDLQDLLIQILTIMQAQFLDILAQYTDKYSIDTADGVWLDYVGYRLGVFNRPSYENPGEYFGFDDTGTGFDQAPFENLALLIPIDDDYFRAFLKARAQQLITDCSLESIRNALLLFFEEVFIIDNYDMTMSVNIITAIPLLIVRAVLDAGIITKPAAVGVSGQIVFDDYFGFDDTGTGFDQAPFVTEF
jgi:hypothetical protein